MPTQLFASSRSRCLHCDSHVTDQFCRVFGDDDDRVHRCSKCDSYIRLSRGSGAGVDVSIPDPEVASGRHVGGRP
jgi:formate dehydrogenase maturation protein FdhE